MHIEDNTDIAAAGDVPADSDLTADVTAYSNLTADVSAIGGPSTSPTYDIDPADRSIADSILAMDPMDAPPPYEIPHGWKVPPLRVTALPKDRREEVYTKLDALPDGLTPKEREAKEAEFTADVVRSMQSGIRVKTGLGRDALPYHREMMAITVECQELAREFDRLSDELTDVQSHRTEIDPATGEAKPVPVYRVQGARHAAYVAQQADLARRMRLLIGEESGFGLEGQKRIKQALFESVGLIKARDQQVAEHAEAKRRAEEMAREERINAQARSIARMQHSAP